MKKYLLAALAVALTACSAAHADKTEIGSSEDEPFPLPIGKTLNANADYKGLSREKHGYGQGVQLDAENRPLGAIDFNSNYSKYDAYAIGENTSKTITLTFDQGYENGYTAKILDTLKEKNVKAVFFLLKDYAERNPELVERMIAEGHTVGNHSVTHRSMPSLTSDECRSEVMDMHKYVKDKFGAEMTLFRPPMGEFSELSLAVTQDCGYKTLLWSFAYADWDPNKQPDRKQALDKLAGALHNGAVYLLHSVSSTNADILGEFIDNAKNKGYDFTV